MLTCIINQFDCNAGTNGLDFCISGDSVKLAKPLINKVTGKFNISKWERRDLNPHAYH